MMDVASLDNTSTCPTNPCPIHYHHHHHHHQPKQPCTAVLAIPPCCFLRRIVADPLGTSISRITAVDLLDCKQTYSARAWWFVWSLRRPATRLPLLISRPGTETHVEFLTASNYSQIKREGEEAIPPVCVPVCLW